MREITLTQGKVALVDDQDYDRVSSYRWTTLKQPHTCYAYTKVREGSRWKTIYLHRLILGVLPGFKVDHVSGNGLDCRRSNLRIVDDCQSNQNRTGRGVGFKGLSKTPSGKWNVRIRANGKTHRLGIFESDIEAAKAYDEAALRLCGPFARLNFQEAA